MMVVGGSLLLWSHGPNSADARVAVDKVDGHLKRSADDEIALDLLLPLPLQGSSASLFTFCCL